MQFYNAQAFLRRLTKEKSHLVGYAFLFEYSPFRLLTRGRKMQREGPMGNHPRNADGRRVFSTEFERETVQGILPGPRRPAIGGKVLPTHT